MIALVSHGNDVHILHIHMITYPLQTQKQTLRHNNLPMCFVPLESECTGRMYEDLRYGMHALGCDKTLSSMYHMASLLTI
jgi:hypothetical protein